MPSGTRFKFHKAIPRTWHGGIRRRVILGLVQVNLPPSLTPRPPPLPPSPCFPSRPHAHTWIAMQTALRYPALNPYKDAEGKTQVVLTYSPANGDGVGMVHVSGMVPSV